MTEATRILAIRHGETAWNIDTRIQGHLDIGLNATGRWQAQRVAAALADESIAAIYSSDLVRAWDTARSISQTTGIAVQSLEGLRERGFGSFEGKTFDQIALQWPDAAVRWQKRDPAYAPEGGGESLMDFSIRITSVVDALVYCLTYIELF